jgi:hypothetical protein
MDETLLHLYFLFFIPSNIIVNFLRLLLWNRSLYVVSDFIIYSVPVILYLDQDPDIKRKSYSGLKDYRLAIICMLCYICFIVNIFFSATNPEIYLFFRIIKLISEIFVTWHIKNGLWKFFRTERAIYNYHQDEKTLNYYKGRLYTGHYYEFIELILKRRWDDNEIKEETFEQLEKKDQKN